jgi:hypothetical protein
MNPLHYSMIRPTVLAGSLQYQKYDKSLQNRVLSTCDLAVDERVSTAQYIEY